jgi:glycosyltransferase involved in cell wall biosynthesis
MAAKKKIVTFFSGEIKKSLGPAIHFTELWNNFNLKYSDEYDVLGYCGYSEDKETFTKINFPIEFLKMPNVKKIRYFLLDFLFCLKLIKHRKDIIYFRLTVINFLCAFVIKIFKIKPIVELNGIAEKDLFEMRAPKLFNKMSIWQANTIIRSSSACIGVGDDIKNDALAKGAPIAISCLNGVSTRFFEMPQLSISNQLKVIFVGTFTPFDGARHIITIAAAYPEIQFNIYGDGDNTRRDELKSRATKNVTFHGYVKHSDLPEIYAQHHLGFVMYEGKRDMEMTGSSLKTLEYIASGLPIFTSKTKAQFFVGEDEIGFNSDPEAMIEDFQLFIAQLENYKQKVQHYRTENKKILSWERVADATAKLIHELY